MLDTGNQLLDRLPPAEYELIAPSLRSMSLAPGRVLAEEGELVDRVYFPLPGAVGSMVTVMHDGPRSVESLVVGSEGVLGLHVLLGVPVSPWQTTVQVAGDALVAGSNPLRSQRHLLPTLRDLIEQQACADLQFCAQSVGCNRFHPLEERAARWLLTVHDRVQTDELGLTQLSLSRMLGTHRPSVTLALRVLQQAGLIDQVRAGVIAIADRPGLEEAACECYARVSAYPARAIEDAPHS